LGTGGKGFGQLALAHLHVLRHRGRLPTEDLEIERNKLQSLLSADVYHVATDAERAAVKEGFEKLVADLRLNEPFAKPGAPADAYKQMDPDAVRRNAERRLEELRDMRAPVLSASLRKSLGMQDAAE
jgi:hypothetical protein